MSNDSRTYIPLSDSPVSGDKYFQDTVGIVPSIFYFYNSESLGTWSIDKILHSLNEKFSLTIDHDYGTYYGADSRSSFVLLLSDDNRTRKVVMHVTSVVPTPSSVLDQNDLITADIMQHHKINYDSIDGDFLETSTDIKLFFQEEEDNSFLKGLVDLNTSCRVKYLPCDIESDPKIHLITSVYDNLTLKSISMSKWPKPEDEDLELHYGKSLVEFHKELVKEMTSDDNKGIVLFHGIPGSGKTYYIRRLCSELQSLNKTIVLLQSSMFSELGTPEFTEFMLENFHTEQIVFILEDAESLLLERGENESGSADVSFLLNVTDGILNDLFNVQVIATFNTDISNIDSAVLRSGRLMAKRHFGSLSVDNSKNLARHLGVTEDTVDSIKTEMSLADVYSLRKKNKSKLIM